MSDKFPGSSIECVIPVLRPKGEGWREVPLGPRIRPSYPLRAFIHDQSGLPVLSAVELIADEGSRPEYHLSISKQKGAAKRCDLNEAKWVLRQFEFDGAIEDNHVPSGFVRNFWRPVADHLVGQECKCRDSEPKIREDKGDSIWRPAPRR